MSGAPFTHLPEVGSTNDWLLARAASLPDGHWVLADRQTAGRGRRGRAWSDGDGNLMASVLVRAAGPVQQLSFVAALALREAILRASGERAPIEAMLRWDPGQGVTPCTPSLQLKWPNDLLLGGVKVSGILLERAGEALVIGFGANLAQHPTDSERPATSLAAAGWAVPMPIECLGQLMPAFAVLRALWARAGFEPIRAQWLAHAAGVGDRIAARLGAETLEGRFEGLDPDGALALQLDDGTRRAVHAGEVFAL